MRKITLLQVTELHKRYEGRTDVILEGDGYVSGDGIGNGITVEFTDAECPELHQRLLVMVETLPDLGSRIHSIASGDSYADYLEKRKAELASPQQATKPIFTNGRKFR